MDAEFCIIIIVESKTAKNNAIVFKLICGYTC